jgi:hypothetical protein
MCATVNFKDLGRENMIVACFFKDAQDVAAFDMAEERPMTRSKLWRSQPSVSSG